MPTATDESASALSHAPAARAASQRSAAPRGPEKAASDTFNTARTFGDGRGLGVGRPTLDDVDVDDGDIDAVLVARGACENPRIVPFVLVGNGEGVFRGLSDRDGNALDRDRTAEYDCEGDTDPVAVGDPPADLVDVGVVTADATERCHASNAKV